MLVHILRQGNVSMNAPMTKNCHSIVDVCTESVDEKWFGETTNALNPRLLAGDFASKSSIDTRSRNHRKSRIIDSMLSNMQKHGKWKISNAFKSISQSYIMMYHMLPNYVKKDKIWLQIRIFTTQHNIVVLSIKSDKNRNKLTNFDIIWLQLVL